ncbi:MAG TPA: HlyD family efflux transporter periplasmic adaptor subunit [Candidatus Angelobacter sp.]|nr:HlyD family efflux transporter periplasmic adaptor subunit [Candidatus Angelobacter sp.]
MANQQITEIEPKTAKPEPAPVNDTSGAAPAARSRSRRFVPLVVLAVLAGAGYFLWKKVFYSPPIPDSIVILSGRIEGDDSAVSPKTTGRILDIHFREGDLVTAGAVIATLDDQQIRAREDQARAALLESQARVKSARDQIAVLEEQLQQNQDEVRQQEAAAQLADFDKDAYTRLAKTGAVSERQGKQAATTAEQQTAVVAAAKRRVGTVRMQLAQQKSEVATAEAAARQAQAQLAEAQANRRDLIVRAPFDGTVTTRSAEPGEVVTAGTPIITLLDLSKVYLRGFVPEGQIGKVKLGQAAHIYLDSNPKQPVDAYVSRIDPQATFTPENTYFRDDRVKQVVGVKLQLKGAFGYAKPGMPADGEILVEGSVWPPYTWKR